MGRPALIRYEKSKSECKCLRCSMPTRQVHDGETLLICGDEACDLKCDTCTNRPTSACKFKPKVVTAEIESETREVVAV